MNARALFDHLRTNLHHLTINEIKDLLRPLIDGMVVDIPVIEPGHFVYRARRIQNSFSKSSGIKKADLIYPPKSMSKIGRLNRPSEPMFYCSVSKEAVFFELQDMNPGDELILTIWRTTEPMLVNNIGYTQRVFENLGAARPCPTWRNDSATSGNAVASIPDHMSAQAVAAIANDANRELRELLSKEFTCNIGPTESDRYKLTVAIGELHLGPVGGDSPQFAGILYPSMRMWANADNLALLPWVVDAHLNFQKAIHVRMNSRTDSTFAITNLDVARSFGADGRLMWLGRLLNWQVPPGRRAIFRATSGPDVDGDYEYNKDGGPCHWVGVDADSGKVIEAT